MAFIINPYIFGTAASVASKTFRAGLNDSANATTYSGWGSITVGASDTGVIIGVLASGATRNISSATVTGNVSGARTVNLVLNNSASPFAGFITADLASDTSITVSITFSGGESRCQIFVWSVQNTTLTASATNDSDTTGPYSATITTPANGLGFAVVDDSNSGSPTISWTTYTEDSELAGESGRVHGAASIAGSDSTGPTATYSATSGGRLAVATFAPV